MRLVFVSSTFKDMQFERDELNIRLTPRINEFLLKYGENVCFSDLRWGVNTSELENEESSKKVLKVCLDEIDNAKPYMIVFIGERYGWIPSSTLLEETMEAKGIDNVPGDISVTNLEIEYGALLNPDFEGRILFYFRRPFDTSKMNEEERKIYESESPLHKEKLEALKAKILSLYPDYVRYYDVNYDEKTKSLTGLDVLMEQIYNDLTRVFVIDYKYLNSLSNYQRAIMNSEAYFENFYKNAYFRDHLADTVDPNSELTENFEDGRYEDIPCLRYVTGSPGMGRKTTIACLYKLAKEVNKDYVIPFVFGLDKYTEDRRCLLETLISFYEEKLGYKHYKAKNVFTLADLIKYNDEHDKYHFQIFIMNYHQDIIQLLKELEFYIKEMYHTTFYIMGNSEVQDYVPYLDFAFHSDFIALEELNDEEKLEIINRLCQRKHKELSSMVVQEIMSKENSGIPIYLSLVVERLLMLDSDDFASIRQMGDGMDAINQYMINIVRNIGDDVYSITKELFQTLAERINLDLVMHVLYLASHKCLLRIDQYQSFFAFINKEYNQLDFSLLVNTIPSLFMPITMSDSLQFAFNIALEVAKELSEEYIDGELIDKYIEFIGDEGENIFFKMKIYRFIDDVEDFYNAFITFLNRKKPDNDSNILDSDFIICMNDIASLLKEDNDDFLTKFIVYSLEQIISNNLDEITRNRILSVIFYPFIFGVGSEKEKAETIKGMNEVTEYLNKVANDKNENYNLVAGLVNYLNTGVKIAQYHHALEIEKSEKYEASVDELESNFNQKAFYEMLNEVTIATRFYVTFNDLAVLVRTITVMNYDSQIVKYEDYYQDFVNRHLDLAKLNTALENDDFDLWRKIDGVNMVAALFYELLLYRCLKGEEEYHKKLNDYLKMAELILQHDFFDLRKANVVESYFVESLFGTFASLVNDENVDEITKYNLKDWLRIRSKEMTLSGLANYTFIKSYASILAEDVNGIPSEDFFFLYPLIYKRVQNEFDIEVFNTAFELLSLSSCLYKSEVDLEFLYLIGLYIENNDEYTFQIYSYLSALLYYQGRNVKEDDLISNTYAYLYDDFEFENQEALEEWTNNYLKYAARVVPE